MDEEADAGDSVVSSLKPEKKRFAGRQYLEDAATWTPKINFVDVGSSRKEPIPLEVSVGNPGSHL